MHPHYNSNYSGDIALFYLSGAAELHALSHEGAAAQRGPGALPVGHGQAAR